MITTKKDALKEAGMPESHGDVFIKVAKLSKCVIMCRVPGIYAEQLISEGYASKGFHNKAKSCNWGPMAGFVMDNPLFSKAGLTTEGKDEQKDEIEKAKKEGTTETMLFITGDRKSWLFRKELIEHLKTTSLNDTLITYVKPIMTHCQGNLVPQASQYRFRLEKTTVLVDNNTYEDVYAVQFKKNENEKRWINCEALVDRNWNPERSHISFDFNKLAEAAKDFEAVYGGPNKNVSEVLEESPIPTKKSKIWKKTIPEYKKASTGDYDLFAVWPDKNDQWTGKDGNKKIEGLDTHTVAPKDMSNKQKVKDGTHPDLGIYSRRVAVVRFLLNEFIRAAGYLGGDMVHHGAESGRPYMKDVDLPFLVFFPPYKSPYNENCALVQTIEEFDELIEKMVAYYKIGLNPGWVKALFNKFGDKQDYENLVIEGDPKLFEKGVYKGDL